MNFNEFVNEVKDNIRLFLPKDYENAEVSTMECQKLNRAYTGPVSYTHLFIHIGKCCG